MKQTLAFLLAAVAGAAASPASAADVETSPGYDWTGPYLGIHGGYAWGSSKSDDIFAYDLEPESWFGGIQAGYNQQLSNNLVLGIEADVSFGDLKDDSLVLTDVGFDIPTEASTKIETFGTVRARAGYAFDRILPYVTAGLGWARQEVDYFQDYNFGLINNLNDTKTYFGWTVGAGIEAALADNWTARIEYLYTDLGSEKYDGVISVFGPYTAEIDLHIQTVRLGLNYKFD